MEAGEVESAVEYTLEGIGSEVWLAFGVFSSVVIGIFLLLIIWRSGDNNDIHPEQQETVDRARTRLREDNNDDDNPPEENTAADIPQCPVCLGGVVYPIETNCGHVFCARCILQYWHADRWPNTCRCPVCRREVSLLMTDPRLNQSGRYRELYNEVVDYNQRMSGQWRSFTSYLYDVPTLLRLLWRDLFTVGGLMCIHRLHILIVVFLLFLYVLLPLDILPESFLGLLGFIDDIVIILGALVYLTLIYRAYVIQRQI